MKIKLTETKFKSLLRLALGLFRKAACLGAVILICSSASAENLFVSAYITTPSEILTDASFGAIVEFTWDGQQSIFARGLTQPGDVAFDSTGNLFLTDCNGCGTLHPALAIY